MLIEFPGLVNGMNWVVCVFIIPCLIALVAGQVKVMLYAPLEKVQQRRGQLHNYRHLTGILLGGGAIALLLTLFFPIDDVLLIIAAFATMILLPLFTALVVGDSIAQANAWRDEMRFEQEVNRPHR